MTISPIRTPKMPTNERIKILRSQMHDFTYASTDQELAEIIDSADRLQEDESKSQVVIGRKQTNNPWKLSKNDSEVFLRPGKSGKFLNAGGSKNTRIGLHLNSLRRVAVINAPIVNDRMLATLRKEDYIKKQFLRAKGCKDLYFSTIYEGSKAGHEQRRYESIAPLGTDLYDWILSKEVSIQERIGVMQKMTEELKSFHGLGYVHRDVKLENFLIFEESEVRIELIDFGDVAISEEDFNRPRGTMNLLAPEVYARNSQRKPVFKDMKGAYAGDVYALGAAFFSLLRRELHPFSRWVESYIDVHAGLPDRTHVIYSQHKKAQQCLRLLIDRQTCLLTKGLYVLIYKMTSANVSRRPCLDEIAQILESSDNLMRLGVQFSKHHCIIS